MEIIYSKLLSSFPELIHGFSTKQWGNMSYRRDIDGQAENNNLNFLGALGYNTTSLPILDPCLNHGNTVAWLKPNGRKGRIPVSMENSEVLYSSHREPIMPPDPNLCPPDAGIDACWTDTPGTLLAMRPADCAIIFMYDPQTRSFGLTHAGTAGVFSCIVAHSIEMAGYWHGIKPQNLRCYIAPSVSAEAYDLQRTGAWQKALHKILSPEVAHDYNPKSRIRNQLVACGVLPEHVEISPECTATDTHRFFSHSRAKNTEEQVSLGRMLAIIGLRS